MSPEQLRQFEEMKRELEELRDFKKALESSHSIPLAIDQSFRARFLPSLLQTSSKSSSSENKTVDEAGLTNYPVLQPPDGFLQTEINSVTYYIPYFT